MIYPKVVRGGSAIPIGENLFLMKGRKHKNGGIDIGKDLEVEGDEVMQTSPNEIKVFSAQKFLGGESPADLVLAGANPDRVFAAQERYKDEHKINDDGTKQKKSGGKVINWIKDKIIGNKKNNSSPVEGNDNSNATINFDNLKLTNNRSYSSQYLSDIYNGLIQRGINKNQAITIVGTIAEESGGDVFAKSKDNKFTGLLQWEDRRYKIQYPEDRDKELNAQLDYIADTLTNAQQRKDNGFTDDWTDGGKGSGYNSWKDAYNDFNDYTNVYNMTRGLNTGYVRPTGGIKGNTGSITNRMNAARQIFENNGITDLQYEPKKQKFGGMSKNKKDTFMDSLMKSITDLDKVELGNRNNPQLNGVDAEILDNELNRDMLLQHSHSTGVQKRCGGRVKKLQGGAIASDGKFYKWGETLPEGVTWFPKRDISYENGYKIPNNMSVTSSDNSKSGNKNNTLAGLYWGLNGAAQLANLATGIGGAIINARSNNRYLDEMSDELSKLKTFIQPHVKLQTRYDINPQLSYVRDYLGKNIQNVDENTASSQVALNRKRDLLTKGILKSIELYGEKNEKEKQAYNQEALQNAQIDRENIQRMQETERIKNEGQRSIIDKRAETETAKIQNLTGAMAQLANGSMGLFNNWLQFKAALAGAPNSQNALLNTLF